MADDLGRGPATSVQVPEGGAERGSPAWWVDQLARRIGEDKPTMELWWRYYVGDHPIPKAPDKIRDRVESTYRPILQRSRANFMGVVVDAVAERCRPIGFRLGADSDYQDDLASWDIWQASNMDSDAPLSIETSLAKGRAYLSVWKHDDEDLPRIAVEDPTQTIVAHAPGSRHRRLAALKTYIDEWTGQTHAELMLPKATSQAQPDGGLYRFRRQGQGVSEWTPLPGDDAWEPLPDGYTGVPMVPIYNKPRLMYQQLVDRDHVKWGGDSEIGDVTPIQDRINETILNLVIAQWFAAFKQRYAAGLVVDEEPVLDGDGNPIMGDDGKPMMVPVEPFDVWMDRLWTVDDEKVKFGEFSESDLEKYLKIRERDLQDLSTIKRIPRHYLFQSGQSPSGDAIKSAETGLVALSKRKHADQGEGFEESIRIARQMAGRGEARPDSEIVYADPEFRTYGELVDGVIKEFQAGLVPWDGAMEKLGYTPQQIARFRGQRDLDVLLRAVEELEPAADLPAAEAA